MATVMSPENEPKTFSDLNNGRQDGRHPRLVVQIPAQDEAQYIGTVIGEIPLRIVGIAEILVIVINDGSIDDTAAIAKQAGADYVLHHVGNRGLAAAYRTGLDAALRLGADIVVNLDADGQYDPKDIPRLIQPILAGKTDIVVGDRRPSDLQHFSPLKRWLQAIGSWTVRRISGSEVPDAASGFRALSREAALRTNVLTDYTYTLETIIQAGAERTAISSVTVSTRPTKRKSRLVRGIWSYVQLSMLTLLRTYTMYSPLKVFITAGALIGLVGTTRHSAISLLCRDGRQRRPRPVAGDIRRLVGARFSGRDDWVAGRPDCGKPKAASGRTVPPPPAGRRRRGTAVENRPRVRRR